MIPETAIMPLLLLLSLSEYPSSPLYPFICLSLHIYAYINFADSFQIEETGSKNEF